MAFASPALFYLCASGMVSGCQSRIALLAASAHASTRLPTARSWATEYVRMTPTIPRAEEALAHSRISLTGGD